MMTEVCSASNCIMMVVGGATTSMMKACGGGWKSQSYDEGMWSY